MFAFNAIAQSSMLEEVVVTAQDVTSSLKEIKTEEIFDIDKQTLDKTKIMPNQDPLNKNLEEVALKSFCSFRNRGTSVLSPGFCHLFFKFGCPFLPGDSKPFIRLAYTLSYR